MAEIVSELAGAPRLLLGLDFDGTLAPIVSDPASARMPEETRQIIEALAARPGTTVAVISGRSLEDLRSRVGPKVILGGNHGLETLEHGILWRHPQAVRSETLLRKLCDQLRVRVRGIRGALLENKGLTASVHYRNVDDGDVPRLTESVGITLAPYDCFSIRNGAKVIEIVPAVAWNKGSAMLHLLESMRKESGPDIAVCYIGDDTTDESVFEALKDAITIRLCANCPTAARFRARNIEQVKELLGALAAREETKRQAI